MIQSTKLAMEIYSHALGSLVNGNGTFIPKKPVTTAKTAKSASKMVKVVKLSFRLLFRMLL